MSSPNERTRTVPEAARTGGTRRTSSSPAIPVALLIACVALLPILASGYSSTGVRTQIVLGAIAVLLLAIAGLVLINALPGNGDGLARWRLGPWFLVWSALSYGIASLTWLGPQTGVALRISLTSIPVALTMVAASLVAWTAGYVTGPPKAVRGLAAGALAFLLRGTSTGTPGAGIPWLLYGIGTAARAVSLLLAGRFGYVGDPSGLVVSAKPYAQALSTVSMLAVFGIAVAAYRVFSIRKSGSRATLWTLVVTEMVVGAVAGGKASFVIALLAVLIPYGAVRGRLSARVILVGTMLFLLVVLPFNAAYRSVVRSGHEHLSPAEAVAATPELLSDVVATETPADVLADSANTFLLRVRMIDNVALIAQLTPSVIAYRSPIEFAFAPAVSLIPRAVWPDKPILATGYEFSQEYYGRPSTVYTSSAITPLGDLYRHGGWYVLIVGALLFGLACRLFDTLFRAEGDLRAIFFLLMFLPVVVKSEADVFTMIVGIPTGVAAAVLGAHVACRARRASAAGAAGGTDPLPGSDPRRGVQTPGRAKRSSP